LWLLLRLWLLLLQWLLLLLLLLLVNPTVLLPLKEKGEHLLAYGALMPSAAAAAVAHHLVNAGHVVLEVVGLYELLVAHLAPERALLPVGEAVLDQ
jgi:hypothetical protein